jgi:hypothetical protein
VQSVPDATSSPSIDQEVPSVFHPVPFRFSFDPPSDPASVSAFVKAYPNLPRYHMWSSWDRLTAVSTYGPPGSEEEDGPDSGWDFSGLRDPSVVRDFMTACDYCPLIAPMMATALTTKVVTQLANVSTSI